MTREVVTDIQRVRDLFPSWMGHDFAVDLETDGLDYNKCRILGIALSFDDNRHYYLVIAHTKPDEEGNYPTHEYMPIEEVTRIISPLFLQRDRTVVAHNLKFEVHFLSRVGIEFFGRLADTVLAAQLIDENRELGLKKLAHLVDMDLTPYMELVSYPGFKKHEILGVPLEAAAQYAMDDSEATWKLWQRFRVELVEEGVDRVFAEVWMPLLLVLQQMEAKGIRLNLEKVREVRDEYVELATQAEWAVWEDGMKMLLRRYKGVAQEEFPKGYLRMASEQELEELITTESGEEFVEVRGMRVPVIRPTARSKPRVPHFNIGSNDQLADLLYNEYGLQPPKDLKLNRTKDGGFSVDRNTLKVIDLAMGEDSPEIIKHVLQWRKASKFIGTYLDRFIEDAGGDPEQVIRTTFNQHVTDTGRLSSSQPNLQNVPSRGPEGAKARSMFVARPGHKLVVADFGAMELRMCGHFSQDPTMVKAFSENLDLHTLMAAKNTDKSYEEMKTLVDIGDPWAKQQRTIGKTQNFCVPLDTLCLTRTGWKTYDQVVPGVDETIGYNPATGMSEWTPITAVSVFDSAELMQLSNAYWTATCTPNHRWMVEARSWGKRKHERFVEAQSIATDHRIRVAAPLVGGGTSSVSPQDAALVAWLWSDGHIRRSSLTGHTSQGKDGRRRGFQATIFQIKEDHVEHLESFVLQDVPHTKYKRSDGNVVWNIDPQYMRDLWDQHNMDEITPEQFVLRLSSEARKAFLDAVERADGHVSGSARIVSQMTGIPDAIRLLIYMAGSRPGCNSSGKIKFCNSHITGQRLQKQRVAPASVWCPTTQLGTWTMRQGDVIGLTGNSLLYGMSPQKFRTSLRVETGLLVSLAEAESFVRSFDELYEGVTEWKQRVIQWARRLGYVQTITGRKRRLPDIKSSNKWDRLRAERMGVNAVIQGSCADIVAECIPAIQQALAPINGYVLLQVHDEVVAEAPNEHAETARRIVEAYMTALINPRLRVPLIADAHIGESWGAAKG